MNIPTPQEHLKSIHTRARRLQPLDIDSLDTSGRADHQAAGLDLGGLSSCAACEDIIQPPRKRMQCSACKAVIYCSKNCATRGWEASPVRGAVPHKLLCADNKRHMRRLPETVAIVAQFPWGRLEKDGSFNYEVARARFNVLGQDRCGYWSCRSWPLSVAHSSVEVETIISGSATGPQAKTIRERLSRFDYVDGKVLLKTAHLSDTDGWKLKAHLIPLRDFASVPERTPVIVTDFAGGVVDWDTWYRWRKLSKLSPAALLMHFVMSTFWLLTRSLGVTRVDSGAKDKRVSLTIHYLGAEIELNFIPLFSELALLLPHHDIKIVFFGGGAHKLGQEAKKHPGSLAAQASPSSPVFAYSAPASCGSGSISAFLCTTTAVWTPIASLRDFSAPDAILACNAGLGTYPEWQPVVQAAHRLHIPFGVTEYCEQSAETQVYRQFPAWLGRALRDDYEIALNPSQRPGQRQNLPVKFPYLSNGFAIAVMRAKEIVNVDALAPVVGQTPLSAEPDAGADHLFARIRHIDMDLD